MLVLPTVLTTSTPATPVSSLEPLVTYPQFLEPRWSSTLTLPLPHSTRRSWSTSCSAPSQLPRAQPHSTTTLVSIPTERTLVNVIDQIATPLLIPRPDSHQEEAEEEEDTAADAEEADPTTLPPRHLQPPPVETSSTPTTVKDLAPEHHARTTRERATEEDTNKATDNKLSAPTAPPTNLPRPSVPEPRPTTKHPPPLPVTSRPLLLGSQRSCKTGLSPSTPNVGQPSRQFYTKHAPLLTRTLTLTAAPLSALSVPLSLALF
jgi:hypothetical protein